MIHDTHFYHQTDLSLELQISNIAVNIGRIGNWVLNLFELKKAKGEKVFHGRLELINKIITQTDSYLNDFLKQKYSDRLTFTLERFKNDFEKLKEDQINEKNYLYWGEKALTWANILQHRAKLV